MTHNALQTLWGSGDPEQDQSRRNTAKSMICPGTREQTIYTPQSVVDGLLKLWPQGIGLDPCSGPGSIVPAKRSFDGITGDGLVDVWAADTVYVNSPYKHLKDWLAKAIVEAASREIVLLCPTRHHRKWFRAAVLNADAVCYLNPLKFHGYKQAFPAPLCLMYWGMNDGAFEKAFNHLGECL